jgi:hypothetical protein
VELVDMLLNVFRKLVVELVEDVRNENENLGGKAGTLRLE